eukprot:g3853.t1
MTSSLQCCRLNNRLSMHRTKRIGPSWSPSVDKRNRAGKVYCQSESRLQRPKAPKPREEVKEEEDSSSVVESPSTEAPVAETESATTVEYQRRQAKALVKYFESLKLQKAATEPVFGWTLKNEIGNGRWVMFGLLVGLLTEYATGVNIVDQIKLMISNLGIADIYE